MDKQILLSRRGDEIEVAVIEDNVLVERYIEADDAGSLIGNIFVGRVENVLDGMSTAFVNIGIGINAFLSFDDIAPGFRVKQGMELTAQVYKQPGGDKGPRLTMNVSIPGAMLVLTPMTPTVSISSKINSQAERTRLKELARQACPKGMGLIVRTSAAGAELDALMAEANELQETWRGIAQKAPYTKAPALLYESARLTERTVRDMLQPDVSRLWTTDESLYKQALQAATPDQAVRISFEQSPERLSTLFSLTTQISKIDNRQVWLNSGGYIIVDYTEAMTVIDVNSGKFVGKHSLEETVFRTNTEAAVEIARQLRLRDIGGIVIIDFIDMAEEEHRQQLLDTLAAELKKDRSKTNMLGMTKLGLVEMTRKKIQPRMGGARAICPTCKGTGRIR